MKSYCFTNAVVSNIINANYFDDVTVDGAMNKWKMRRREAD